MPLEAGPDLFRRHFDVSRETIDRLIIYERLLREAGATLSLVGRSTLDAVWQRHFLDSAQLVSFIDSKKPLADIGTGAGFPGMVLAIIGAMDVHLVENNQKKIAFLHRVAVETETYVTIHNVKAEAWTLDVALITARALAPLGTLLELAQRQFLNGANGLFPKGKSAAAEIAAAHETWDFAVEVFASLTSEESSVLRLSRIRRRK